ncbi:hypothetical protein [Metabacillus fastidiosus]|uniref:hypothetical protein n=1 Tax=Metabacillus fastidiosus TaxID=1458 RepID=UPI003D2B23DB
MNRLYFFMNNPGGLGIVHGGHAHGGHPTVVGGGIGRPLIWLHGHPVSNTIVTGQAMPAMYYPYIPYEYFNYINYGVY